MAGSRINQNEIKQERARLAGLFSDSDPVKLAVLEGLIDEAAKCRCELRYWTTRRNEMVSRGAPFAATIPIDNLIIKLRASFTNINEKLCKWLTGADGDDFADELENYE